MKHLAEATPLPWVGGFSLAIVLACTLAAWGLSRENQSTSLLIEPLQGQIIEVTAPDWSENSATDISPADEQSKRTLPNDGDSSSVREPQIQ